MKKIHHYLCKISIIKKHSPETETHLYQCDCDFIENILNKEQADV
jgi:hypothetical protein